MGISIGAEGGILGMVEEDTYGTAVAREKFLELNSGADGIKTNKGGKLGLSAGVASINMNLNKAFNAPIEVGGDVAFDARYEGMELILKGLFGDVTTTQPDVTGSPTVYQHLFEITEDLPFFTWEIDKDEKASVIEGVKIAACNFALAADGVLIVTPTIIAEDIPDALATVTASTLPTAALITFAEATLKWNTAAQNVKNLSLTIENPLVRRYYLGSRLTKEPVRAGKVNVVATFDVDFESTTLWDDFVAATNRALQLKCTGTAIDASYNYDFQLDVPVALLTDANINVADEGPIPQTCEIKGFLSGSDEEAKLTLINTVTSV